MPKRKIKKKSPIRSLPPLVSSFHQSIYPSSPPSPPQAPLHNTHSLSVHTNRKHNQNITYLLTNQTKHKTKPIQPHPSLLPSPHTLPPLHPICTTHHHRISDYQGAASHQSGSLLTREGVEGVCAAVLYAC